MKLYDYIKHRIVLFLILVMTVTFVACGYEKDLQPSGTTDKEIIELWVVTEDISPEKYSTIAMIEAQIESFEAEHENVTIRLDILPTVSDEREAYLENLRVEIMAGRGPDAYLMPIGIVWDNEMLISDVNLAMENGIFADISTYYDNDDFLNTDALQKDVMDAGTLDGKRYVLPLRYMQHVIYADTAFLEENNMHITDISNIHNFLNFVISSENSAWASVQFPTIACNTHFYTTEVNPYAEMGLTYLGQCIDYKSEIVTLPAEELAQFMKEYSALFPLYSTENLDIASSIGSYTAGYPVLGEKTPVLLGSISNVPILQAIANAEGRELSMVPVSATDGEVVANVTFYGAVGAGSKDTETAYEFLRLFLTEDVQWKKFSAKSNRGTGLAIWPMPGFTVRTQNCIEPYWETTKFSSTKVSGSSEAGRELGELTRQTFTDADFSILYQKIDIVRFQNSIEWDNVGNLFYTLQSTEKQYTQADYLEEAKAIIQELEWHLAEG